jgi:hypothetical protein
MEHADLSHQMNPLVPYIYFFLRIKEGDRCCRHVPDPLSRYGMKWDTRRAEGRVSLLEPTTPKFTGVMRSFIVSTTKPTPLRTPRPLLLVLTQKFHHSHKIILINFGSHVFYKICP